MNTTLTILLAMLVISTVAPFVSIYAITLIAKKEYAKHIRIQKTIFWICVTGVVVLELKIRFSGGSGSLIADSPYVDAPFFIFLLWAHIVGAVATYLIWAFLIFWSNKKFKKKQTFPKQFSKIHKKLGYTTIAGLFYTAISAWIVCAIAFFI